VPASAHEREAGRELAGWIGVLEVTRFRFRFTTPYRIASAPFGITPRTTMVDVRGERFHVRFGPWSLETPLANVWRCEETGPFALVKAGGPARMSLVDRGISFATNGDRGLCVRFHEPVAAIEPFGHIRHPAATVTVERTADLRRLLETEA
jgi:hypothetical protein